MVRCRTLRLLAAALLHVHHVVASFDCDNTPTYIGSCPSYYGCSTDSSLSVPCSCLDYCGYDVRCCSSTHFDAALAALAALEAHIAGTVPLSDADSESAATEVAAAISAGATDVLPAFDLTALTVTALTASVVPTEASPIETTGLSWLYLLLQSTAAETLPASDVPALPAAAEFPGALASGASPLAGVSLQIDATYAGRDPNYLYAGASEAVWRSTGLWAAAGEPITVTVPAVAVGQGLGVRIGCHTDALDEKEEVTRAPRISRLYDLGAESVAAASAYGGLVYVTVPVGASLGTIGVSVSGAYAAPYFRLGEHSDAEWFEGIKDHPAPYAELHGRDFVITVPSEEARRVASPTRVLTFWDEVLNATAYLEGFDAAPQGHVRERPERFVLDRQISAGWMHSGYPLMGPNIAAWEALLDVDTIQAEGSWGVVHEIGHNLQYAPWLLPGTTETTCNLWSVYIFEELGAPLHGAATTSAREEARAAYLAGGADFANDWSVWTALDTYLQLMEAFGWDLYRRIFAGYRERSYGSLSEQEKVDEWARRSAEAAGVDLGPFYTRWGHPLSPEVLAELSALPAWADDPMNQSPPPRPPPYAPGAAPRLPPPFAPPPPAVRCEGRDGFDVDYGDCLTYEAGFLNHGYCVDDGAHLACSECGHCVDLCEGRDGFDSGYGDCLTYEAGSTNHGYCVDDGAHLACSECGQCVDELPPSMPPPAAQCEGRDGFDSGYGDCLTYEAGSTNHGYCVDDGAHLACSECGQCVDELPPSMPPPPSPPPTPSPLSPPALPPVPCDPKPDFDGDLAFRLGDAVFVAEVWSEKKIWLAAANATEPCGNPRGDFDGDRSFRLADAVFLAEVWSTVKNFSAY